MWLDQISEVAAGVRGFMERRGDTVHIASIESASPGEGKVGGFLSDLPKDVRVCVHDVVNPTLESMLRRRGFQEVKEHSHLYQRECRNYLRRSLTGDEIRRLEAIRHIVHEYANFVSSAEMVLTGKDTGGRALLPPLNTHVSHAFYLNCRKIAEFFGVGKTEDDVSAHHFSSPFQVMLPHSDKWRVPINKQLAHITYTRNKTTAEIDTGACRELYGELRSRWKAFRAALCGSIYEGEFGYQVRKRLRPYPDGMPSEFRGYDLD